MSPTDKIRGSWFLVCVKTLTGNPGSWCVSSIIRTEQNQSAKDSHKRVQTDRENYNFYLKTEEKKLTQRNRNVKTDEEKWKKVRSGSATTPLRQESHQSTTDQPEAAVSSAFVSSSPPQTYVYRNK